MINKKIHYCWFGRGEMPKLAKMCLASWRKYLPEYEIKEWNEDNFDLNLYPYVREAYDNKKYAFVTDVVRLFALYYEGGIYMDTDVEVLKPLDYLLNFDGVSGFEAPDRIPTGLMASIQGLPLIKELLDEYTNIHFVRPNGSFDLTTNVTRITRTCLKYGFVPDGKLQTIANFTFLPKDYLCPKSLINKEVYLTENSLCIHHFDGSWVPVEQKIEEKFWKWIRLKPHRCMWHIDKWLAHYLHIYR